MKKITGNDEVELFTRFADKYCNKIEDSHTAEDFFKDFLTETGGYVNIDCLDTDNDDRIECVYFDHNEGMVRFEEKKLVIEISRPYPTEYWLETMRGILSVMAIANKELLCREEDILYSVCDFLIEILPNQEDLSEMLSKRGLKP